MKQKLLYLLPLFLLSGCGQATYKNASLPAEERAGLLLKELTLEEKVSLMMDSSKPVERLGIKPYNWWNEALHGVACRAGHSVSPTDWYGGIFLAGDCIRGIYCRIR